MNAMLSFPDGFEGWPDVLPFVLMRDRILVALEGKRAAFEAMYDKQMGRPEIDPVILAGLSILQVMQRMPDRAAVSACLYDVRWRIGLDIPSAWVPFHPTTLVHFRARLAKHGVARLALEAGLEAMRRDGYLKGHRAVRIDSTHALGLVAAMSRLECVRETIRLALDFLAAFGGREAWMPWCVRYEDRNPHDLRSASPVRLRATMNQAGADARDLLARALALGSTVVEAQPVVLLQRVFDEQFETCEDAVIAQRKAAPANAVHNPHDPEAVWSTKRTLGKAGWVGYKLQVCETAPEEPLTRGEPTHAVITAVVTQPATASDNGSLAPVLGKHADGGGMPPETVFADAGYINANELAKADVAGYELCGPIGAPPHSGARFGSDSFAVDIPNLRATCPAGKCSSECSRINEAARNIVQYYFAWAKADCAGCLLANQCLSKKKIAPFRTLQVGERHMLVQARRSLCRTPDYQRRMCRRSGIEGTNSELKRGYGVRRCRYRGRPKTDVQMQLAGAACNLRRWAARLCWIQRVKR
jgi:IS5 family transposase